MRLPAMRLREYPVCGPALAGQHEIAAVGSRRLWLAPFEWSKSFPLRLLRPVKRDAVFLPGAPRVAAGGEAEDFGGAGSDEADALVCQVVVSIDDGSFLASAWDVHMGVVVVHHYSPA